VRDDEDKEKDLKPTYEGLKLSFRSSQSTQVRYLKPTYEGLKPLYPQRKLAFGGNLKPTYEGLKHIFLYEFYKTVAIRFKAYL